MNPLDWIRENYNLVVVLTGSTLLGMAAGVVGCFAVLRRRALTGDALAHAALPGLCVAFALTGAMTTPAFLLGALASGCAGITLITMLTRWTRIKEDAAIGFVLSVFFGLGIALLSKTPSSAGLESFILGKAATMARADVLSIALLAAVAIPLVLLLFKEFRLIAFDPDFANAQGWPGFVLDLVLMFLVAVTVVVGLPAAGVLMSAALLIVPAASARFWTDGLGVMLALAAAFGAGAGALGTYLSSRFDKLPAGPSIVLVAGAMFLASLFFAPERGVCAQIWRRRRLRWSLQQRQFLSALYEMAEPSLPATPAFTLDAIALLRSWAPSQLRRLVRHALHENTLVREGRTLSLTAEGLERAAAAARGERLWKLYLRDHPEMATALLTLDLPPLDRFLPPDVLARLQRQLQVGGQP